MKFKPTQFLAPEKVTGHIGVQMIPKFRLSFRATGVFALFLSLAIVFPAVRAAEAASPAPPLLRTPSLSQTSVAFLYADDIWTVPRAGGEALRLTSTGNVVGGPFYSPDGSQIAYSVRAHNTEDIWIIPATGGIPRRLTWHPFGNYPVGWSPDGKSVLFASMRLSPRHYFRLFTVRTDGSGIPEALPLPAGIEGSFSPDGSSIAYQPITRWEAGWKRYKGGQNIPIWIVNLKTLDLEKIPSDNNMDSSPVWVGDQIYFISDRARSDGSKASGDTAPASLWRYDTHTKRVTLAVPNQGFDLQSAQAGPGALVYEQFGSLHLLDLDANHQPGQDHTLSIQLHGDFPKLAPHLTNISADEIQNVALSPTGQRVAVEAHGEIFTIPADKGDTRNLTNTPGAAERAPAWSPDGKTIAYFSDASGEYQLYLHDQTGFKPPTVIDLGPNPSYFYNLAWSPDSRHIFFNDKHQRLWLLDLPADKDSKQTPTPILVDTSHNGGFNATWAPDSRWITYTRDLDNNLSAVFLYSLDTHAATQVTDGMSDAAYPVFDPNGKFLYFLASTDDGPSQSAGDLSTLDRAQTSAAYVVVLSKYGSSPIPPESDDEKIKEEKKEDDKKPIPPNPPKKTSAAYAQSVAAIDESGDDSKKDDSKSSDAKKEDKTEDKHVDVEIDLEKIGDRILSLPIPARNYGGLLTGKTGVVYLLEGSPFGHSSSDNPGSGIRAVWRFTLDKRKAEQVLSDIDGFLVSADNSKALISQHNSLSIISTDELKPGDGGTGKSLNLSNLTLTIDPRAEWRQIFNETWRIERDFLYDPNTHGLSIPKIKARYAPFLDGLASRSEFSYLSVEMLSEVSIGHMFISGPAHHENGPQTGLLGADYRIEHDRYRIAKILGGQNWTPGLASPLTLPGVYVHQGAYILAVNGKELHAADNLYSFFDGTAGLQTVLHIAYTPDGKDGRDVTVIPIDSEDGLRNLDWIEANRRKVDKLSNNQVAYVYMPNTGGAGYTNFNRYFYAQLDKKALVLDERWNEGGFIADYIVDVLRRQPLAGILERDGREQHDPGGAIFGPKVMLMNQNSGSGGDAMPWYFRKAGLGKLVGTRTWGGLIGIGGYPPLMDGGSVTAPRFAIFGLNGQFEVENHGITPDITVEETPKDFAAGKDLQLETGVNLVLEDLKAHPVPTIPIPPFPNYHQNDGLGKN
jgi:tricorn protease